MSGPRHVLITGASSGLGGALARRYAREGCALSLFGRDADRLEETARACRRDAAEVEIYRCDLTDRDRAVAALVDTDRWRAVDLLIANAGLGGTEALTGPTGESVEQACALVAANLSALLNTVVPLAPEMAARARGHIVIMSSLAGFLGLPQSPVYSAAKAAARLYGEGLRRRLRGSGVGVTVVCPGFVDTPMSASLSTPKPFLWTADRAAAHIVKAVERGRKMVIFPWQLRWAVAAARLLPPATLDRILAAPQFGATP